MGNVGGNGDAQQEDGDARQRLTPYLDSDRFSLKVLNGGGYGVFASQEIQAQCRLLTALSPIVYVVYRKFRKEVCAWCFRYDCGRTWKFKHCTPDEKCCNGGGLVFCSVNCMQDWLAHYGSLALEAYVALEEFLQRAARRTHEEYSGHSNGVPTPDDIEKTWQDFEEQAELIRSLRLGTFKAQSQRSLKSAKRALSETLNLPVTDPDQLSFLLNGILCRKAAPQSTSWQSLLMLQPTTHLYVSSELLLETARALTQLTAFAPLALLEDSRLISRETLEAVFSRDVGNSFGLWSTQGSYFASRIKQEWKASEVEEDAEMLGHGIWPTASFFNHSCDPNVAKERYGRSWVFTSRPLESITGSDQPILSGTELCISYIRGEEDALPLPQRIKRLQDGWNFLCMCSKCVRESQSLEDERSTTLSSGNLSQELGILATL